MKGSRMRGLILTLLWAGLMGAGFDLGLQPIRALVPECVLCNCKEVAYWWDPSWIQGYGSMMAGTDSSLPDAQTSIGAATGTCPAGTLDLQDQTIDVWKFTTPIITCRVPGYVLLEATVVDAGALDPNSAGANWYKCYQHQE